ncbi:hypothetical protein Syun_012468 [Stephania yunnanensis]|uniref:Uncharacterized protein n=1 Tax=Stephania yunnanensis TaxID=152371 RepID=A0AAP0JZG8_9MAGN
MELAGFEIETLSPTLDNPHLLVNTINEGLMRRYNPEMPLLFILNAHFTLNSAKCLKLIFVHYGYGRCNSSRSRISPFFHKMIFMYRRQRRIRFMPLRRLYVSIYYFYEIFRKNFYVCGLVGLPSLLSLYGFVSARSVFEESTQREVSSCTEETMKIESERWRLTCPFFLILLLHSLAILFFTRGFLLARTELSAFSHCSDVSQSPCFHPNPNATAPDPNACWTKPAIDRLVILVLDALRRAPQKKPWMDKLQVLQMLATDQPSSTRIFKAIADPPTTSLQRLKVN